MTLSFQSHTSVVLSILCGPHGGLSGVSRPVHRSWVACYRILRSFSVFAGFPARFVALSSAVCCTRRASRGPSRSSTTLRTRVKTIHDPFPSSLMSFITVCGPSRPFVVHWVLFPMLRCSFVGCMLPFISYSGLRGSSGLLHDPFMSYLLTHTVPFAALCGPPRPFTPTSKYFVFLYYILSCRTYPFVVFRGHLVFHTRSQSFMVPSSPFTDLPILVSAPRGLFIGFVSPFIAFDGRS